MSASDTKSGTRKREEHLSRDGNWRSFPKVPYLQQYVPNGNYYGRIKISGKIIRESLQTTVWTDAKDKLPDFIKKHREKAPQITPPLFSEAVEAFKQEIERDTSIKQPSREYRLRCLRKIELSWPELWELRLNEIAEDACKDWAARLKEQMASHYFNNTIATLRMVIAAGIKLHTAKNGDELSNPADELKRARVNQKELKLPEPSQFKRLVQNIRCKSGGWGRRAADLVEFLAYSGTRINSEANLVRWEDIDWTRKEIIIRGHEDTRTKNGEIRRVPIISDMENLLKRLKKDSGGNPTGPILQVAKCSDGLTRACNDIGIPRITHHDLRHLFATRCIESGVDIPTVAHWLGHKDKGALAMRTYGHLRNEHSQAMARKVRF